MTPQSHGRSTAQRLAVLSTVLIAVTTGTPSTAHAEHSGPAAAPSSRPPAPRATIDAHDPDLLLPESSRLAKPKILTLDQRKLGLTHIVTKGTASLPSRPRPFPTERPAHAREPGRSSTTPAAPSPTDTHDSPRPTATPTRDGRATPKPTAREQHRSLLRTALGLLALLAALILARFALRTRRRSHKEQPSSHTPATASAAQPSATPPNGTARLDMALRALAYHAREAGRDLPTLRAARITTDSLAVLPDDRALAPAPPFTRGDDGWWHLPNDADLMEEHTTHSPPAPYPALATIGTTTLDGHEALLLLNLAYPQAVLLEGNPADVEQVLTALTVELITSPWNSAVDIITTGFGQDLPHPSPGPRTTYLPQAADAVREMSERLLEAAQLPHPELRPHLLLSTHPLHDELAARAAELAQKATPLPLTFIAPVDNGATTHFPQATVLDASRHEPQHLDRLETSVTLQRLTRSDYLQAITALTASDKADLTEQHSPAAADDSASGTAEPVPPQSASAITTAAEHAAPAATKRKTNEANSAFPVLRANGTNVSTPGTLAAGAASASDHRTGFLAPGTSTRPRPATALMPEEEVTTGTNIRTRRHDTSTTETGASGQGPEIRVLGPVEVTGVRPSGHGPRIAQLAALLYFKPGRTADELCTHMDPATPWTAATLNARLHGLRRALGDDPQGRPYVPRRSAGDTPYRLSPAIHCDWTHFHSLTEHPLHHAPTSLQDLEQALTLVRGKPFGGRPLPWAEPLAQEMTTRIIDVAHTIATQRIAPGPHHDLSKARQAIACALDIDDTAELLYRDWLRLEAAAANRSGLHTVISRLQHLTHTFNAPLQPQTEQLITELLHTTQPHNPTS